MFEDIRFLIPKGLVDQGIQKKSDNNHVAHSGWGFHGAVTPFLMMPAFHPTLSWGFFDLGESTSSGSFADSSLVALCYRLEVLRVWGLSLCRPSRDELLPGLWAALVVTPRTVTLTSQH